MRQLATAPDGYGYIIESVLATFVHDETPPRRMAQLTEDGEVIGANEKGHPFETFAAARRAAWARFVERSKAAFPDEPAPPLSGHILLKWSTHS